MGLEDMSKVNCSSVLNVIREAKEISRKEISDITGLSWGGMTKIVNKLFEKGYIEETKSTSPTGAGRTPGVITICKEQNVVVGLDINREGLEGIVINLAGEILQEYFKPLFNWNKHKKAVTLMKDGLVNLQCCVSEKIKLEDYAEGLDMARKRPEGFVKAVFVNE